jgi:hypothetical protein
MSAWETGSTIRMGAAQGEIARVLDGARRRQVRILLLTALAAGAAAALACLLLGAAALLLGARPSVARPVALAGAAAALALAAARAIVAAARTAWTREAAARAVAAGEPALRSDLVSAVELARERAAIAATGRFSVALVDGHIARTAERARRVDLARALPDRPARRGATALLAVAVGYLVALAAGGGGLVRAYGRVLAGEPGGAAPRALDPITGDVELAYRYPAYMRRDPATVSGTGGEVRAPRGTEVRLRTRADRPVKAAEIVIDLPVAPAGPDRAEAGPRTQRLALQVSGERDLAGGFLVDASGTYRFRFLDGRGKPLAEGPPIGITVEPDAFPEVSITSPAQEIEVDPAARVRVEWHATDDVGLRELVLVIKPPAGEERRRPLRTFSGARRDAGAFDLDLAPERLAEGERLLYWLEVTDGDTVSGPKKAASATQVVKIFSETEHRRQVLEQAQAVWEEAIALLGDRLELLAPGPATSGDRLARAEALDLRTRHLHERMRQVAADVRRDRAAPKEIAAGLANVAASVRAAEQRLTAVRQTLARAARLRATPDPGLLRQASAFDAQLDEALEKGILYLEQLLDKRRAEDLVRLAQDLSSRRRDLAGLLEKYRAAPTEEARKEIIARIGRMKEQMRQLMARMGELAKGFNDEHMNEEALAELQRSGDVMGGLDKVEDLLAKGDVEGAMRELDALGGSMEKMLSQLRRTADLPDEKAQELMKEMLAFKRQLEEVQAAQQQVAAETSKVREEYRRRVRERMKEAEATADRLRRLAAEARREVTDARPGVSTRGEPDFDAARDGLADVERALEMRDFDAALDASTRSLPAVQRLAMSLEEDAAMAERYADFVDRDPRRVREAERHAFQAVPKATEVRDALQKMFPDPASVLGQGAQQRLDELARKQGALERRAGELQQGLAQLMQEAPVFPPSAAGTLGESRGHMGQAAEELGRRNPQRGAGEQALALDALSRFKKGLDEAAKQSGGGGKGGFPFPFAEQGSETGDGAEPSRERVEIPGAEAYKVPEEFRKDLLDAMRQGAPEPYRGEVQRYYEELVK